MTPTSPLAGLRAALRLVQRDVDSHPGAGPAFGPDDETGDADPEGHPADHDRAGGARAGGDAAPVSAGPVSRGRGRFQLVGSDQGYFVALPDGRCWLAGAGPLPLDVDAADAVVAVAVGVQECFAEILWHAWPRCPTHGTVLRAEPRALPDEVTWCCDGDEGHDVATVGQLGAAVSRAAAKDAALAASAPPGRPETELSA